MALPQDVNERHYRKYRDTAGGVAVAVTNPDGSNIGTPTGGATASNQTDGSQLTQIVDALGDAVTVTGGKLDVNASVDTTGLALDASLTDASQKSQIVDGSGNVIGATSNALDVNIKSGGAGDGAILDGASSAIKATVKDLTNSNPLTTAIVDANGDQITSFGGGVQYTEGDTDASITGTAVMFETNTGTNTLGVVNASNPLPVSASIDTTGLALESKQLPDDHQVKANLQVGGNAVTSSNPVAIMPPLLGYLKVKEETPLTGFATSAKQDTLLTELQLKADLTETQPVSLASVPTHAVTATDLDIRDLSSEQDSVLSRFDPGTIDSFGHLITGEINNDVDVQFYRAASPPSITDIVTVTTTNGGSAAVSNGMTTFTATTTASSRAKGVSLVPVVYTAGGEVYMIFTAGFTGTGAGTSYQRIGLYNDYTDGFYIGKEANSFGVTLLKGTSATTIAKASWNMDTLVGGAGSKFTRAGTPEAIDLTKLNVWRIRFGWVGSAPIYFEVLSPDGKWVTFHKILQPNLTALPSINTADLYATCDVNSGNSGAVLTIITNCWGAGTTQKLRKLTDTLTNNTLAGTVRSVITGVTTAGGGSYVNVKVNPSGALTAAVTATDGDVFVRSNAGSTFPVNATLQAGSALVGKVSIDQATANANEVVTKTGSVTTATLNAETTKVIGTVNQGTSPWVTSNAVTSVVGNGAASTAQRVTLANDSTGTVAATLAAETTKVIGTVRVASGGIASGAIASGAIASGAIASGALAAGSISSGAAVSGSLADGALVTLGAKADAKSTATDGTAITLMQVAKQISASVQAPPSQAVTNAGTFAVQSTNQANSGVDIGDVTINNSTGAAAVNIQDGGNTITVDGTVTANLSATDNAVLDSIDLSIASKYITGIGHGVKTVTTAGTDVALAASTACKKVDIQSQTDNTSLIAVGASGVDATIATGTGIVLYPGDTYCLEIDNLADVYIDSLVNGEGVRYVFYT